MAFIVVDERQQVENTFHRIVDQVAYISVRRIVDRKTYKPLGRRDFNAVDLAQYLEPTDPEAALEIDEEKARAHERSRLIDAAMQWLDATIEEDIGERGLVNYQVQWWKAKGQGVINQIRVTARNHDTEESEDGDDEDEHDDEEGTDEGETPPPPAIPVMPLPPAMPFPPVPANAWESLARTNLQMQGLWERQIAHSQHVAHHTFGLLERGMSVGLTELRLQLRAANLEIGRLQRQLTEVTGQLLNLRIGTAELGQTTTATSDELRMKETMAKSFIEQMGSLGRLALSSKLGIDPALVSLIDKIMADEKLVALLRDNEVQEMFAEPGATEGLAAFLNMALENHRATKAQKKAEAEAAAANP